MRRGSASTQPMSHRWSELRLRGRSHYFTENSVDTLRADGRTAGSSSSCCHPSPCQRLNHIWKDGILTGITYRPHDAGVKREAPASQVLRPSRNESLRRLLKSTVNHDSHNARRLCEPQDVDSTHSELITCVTDDFCLVINFVFFSLLHVNINIRPF